MRHETPQEVMTPQALTALEETLLKRAVDESMREQVGTILWFQYFTHSVWYVFVKM